ncbi:hypothetical protein RN001_005274 [Aquatica leii]|uniref:E3 ubiquitin-protein ligase listerin n=1 Tax=Aquatica leii TaxID=1421715 RepID=A0AAN7SS13_9COLE|nr:hypothetical protein RN001_005274 [Aquatica leii]
MGGKHKQAQRTKNNARPSSSGRSAEFLGSSIPPFVGFASIKESGVIPGFSLTTDDIDSSMDSNFQLVLKKMNKKDSTTKLKALQEYTELIKTADVEAVKAVLPFWPRLYCALATDVDHKVREATHLAHQQVVSKSKRNLAPFLKQFAGPWFTSQYDTYAPAASAATKSFQDAFPKNKIPEAIVYCQEEILAYICDNLTVHTAQTLSNPKTTTTEDAEAKYQRVLISSLHGYALYLQQLSTEQIEKQTDLNLKIISDSKFWKFVKHKVSAIKSAWFCVISSLCHKSPNFIEKEIARIVGSVFSNLDENDPIVVPSLWEALLSILSTINNWWTYINVEKLLLPKLWKLLRDGGYGNAPVIFPNLLPLISQLPPTPDSNATYCLFFENTFKGMKHQNAISSRKESLAIAAAYVECLRYIIMKNQSDVAFCEKLIRIHLFPVLEWNITDLQIACKGFFNQVAKVIQYWSKNSNNSNFSNYSKYLHYFWNNLNSLFQGLLLNLELTYNKDVLMQFSSRQMDLLLSLKHITTNKHLKVSFDNEKGPEASSSAEDNSFLIDKTYTESLNNIVYNTCVTYVKFINEKRNKELVDCLVCLIQDFDSESFFYRLNSEIRGDNVKENLIGIYRKLLDKWLNDRLICSKSVIDLVFLIFKYLNAQDKMEILNSFIMLKNDECFGWCIAQALSHPHNEDNVVHSWLQNDEITRFLVDIAEKELSDMCTPELSLILKRAFTEKPNGDLYLSNAAVSLITKKMITPLLRPAEYPITLDTCASYAAFLSAILYTTNNKLIFGDELLLAMFNLSCQFDIDPDALSKDTIWEVNTAWQDAVSILVQEMSWEEIEKLTLKCGGLINQAVDDHKNEKHLQHIIEVIVNFVKCLEVNPLRICDVLNLLLKCDSLSFWASMLTEICASAEYVTGHLCSPFVPLTLKIDFDELDILNYCNWMDLIASVLSTPWIKDDEEYEDDIEEKEELQLVINKVSIDDIDDLIMQLFEFLSIVSTFIQHYPCTKYNENMSKGLNSVREKLQGLTKSISDDNLKVIEKKLRENAVSKDWLQIKTYYLYCSQITTKDLYKEYTSLLNECDNRKLKLASLRLTQIFAKYVNFEQVCNRPSTIENIILLRQLLHCEELEVPMVEAFSKISIFKQENKSVYLFESNIANTIQWEQIELLIECMRLYSAILRSKPNCINTGQRDLILLSLVTWSTNTANLKNRFGKLQIKSLIVALSELFISLNEYMKNCDNQDVVNEWKDVFAQGVHKDFMEIWLHIIGIYLDTSKEVHICDLPFLQEFGKILLHLDHAFLFTKNNSSLPKWSKLLQKSCSLLIHPSHVLQLWGYHMLKALLPGLVEVDSAAVITNKPHEKGLIFEQFNVTLCNVQDIVQSILLDFKLGEHSCRIEPYTDSYTYMSAYLLIWDVLLSLCEYSSTELRYQYADWLKNGNFLNNLLDNIYKLLPDDILHCSVGDTKQLSELFSTKFSTSLDDACASAHIEHMACWIYFLTLLQLPALVRQWWSEKELRISQIVEKVTAIFVSPQLCNRELADITKNETKFKNMVVKVHPSVREVVAVYTVDEAQMELVITLKNNYPLTSPDVQCNRQIGGTSHRQWLMQLKMCLLHQNGRIWDGLSLWNNNLDKKFDGVEECYICFAVLHQGTYQLPKLSCHTCKKKFHSACLYKWFSTSNKSTCPICRNLF